MDVACPLSGSYVTVVKEEADPGTSSFDLCTLGVIASCDCASLDVTFASPLDSQPDPLTIVAGETHILSIGEPSYVLSASVPADSCPRLATDCVMTLGIRQKEGRKFLNFVSVEGTAVTIAVPES